MYRKTFAQIDLAAIRHNYAVANQLAPKSRNIAVVKANAYGHGAVQVALDLENVAPALAVAFLDEAIELRDAGVKCPILILEGVADADAMQFAAEKEFWITIHDVAQVAMITSLQRVPNVWVKIDTGMHRLGLSPDTVADTLRRLHAAGIQPDAIVLCTHLATADDTQSEFVDQQISMFRAATRTHSYAVSIANSAGVLTWPASYAEWNRPGYMLYGNSPLQDDSAAASRLRPAMRLTSQIIGVRSVEKGASVGYGHSWTADRRSTIGTVAIGYADGYPRQAANGATTLVNGESAPLVGTVSMDMITIDLTDVPTAKIGDAVVLWGPELPLDRLAKSARTVGYDLLTSVSRRVPREYRSLQ